MTTMSRRKLIITAISGTAFALAGCKTTSTGGVSTRTIEASKMFNYTKAILNAATSVVAVGLSFSDTNESRKYTDLATVIITNITKALDSLKAIVGDSISISLDSTTTSTLIDSIIDNGFNLLDIVRRISSDIDIVKSIVPESVIITINTILPALQTIVSLLKIAIDLVPNTASNGAVMNEAEALSALGVS